MMSPATPEGFLRRLSGRAFRADRPALTLQLPANLIRNDGQGTLTVEAQIVHRGHTTLVVELFGDRRRLIAKLAVTQRAPAASPAAARSREE